MKLVADLHLHSKYSRAVSQKMILPTMALWAEKKGIDLLAIPDWTHPVWLKEIESVIEEEADGIYKLKGKSTKFVFSTELSAIYSQNGKGRRIHNLVMAPSLSCVKKINASLKQRGFNLLSDGRPIIGLSSENLAELLYQIDENIIIVPAHVWTPWFAMYGSKSGFDSIQECWGKYSDKIKAIETGLSSDPLMNWRVDDLNSRSILSFSDAHSPAKMGREATVFVTKDNNQAQAKFDFSDLASAINQEKDSSWKIGYTIEFYPEEGKYHWSGHRNCNICYSPADINTKGIICPVCQRPLTVGVEQRVQVLSKDREVKTESRINACGVKGLFNCSDTKRPPYIMIVPLQEIIAEAIAVKNTLSPKVQLMYEKMTAEFSELELLTSVKLDRIKELAGERIAQGIEKVRSGNIVIKPGFDGEFGIVKIWDKNNNKEGIIKSTTKIKDQMRLF